jgi:hypothetical protein
MNENQIQISKEELESVLSLREKIRNNVEAIGRMNVKKHFVKAELREIESDLDQIYSETEDLGAEEQRIVGEFTSKYGPGSLDVETGIYTKGTVPSIQG